MKDGNGKGGNSKGDTNEYHEEQAHVPSQQGSLFGIHKVRGEVVEGAVEATGRLVDYLQKVLLVKFAHPLL